MIDDISDRIERVRRGTRNLDILAICDEVMRQHKMIVRLQSDLKVARRRKTADRTAYNRDYMREYRKRAK